MTDGPRLAPGPYPLRLFLTPPHDCGYLEDRLAETLVVDPARPMDPELYDLMLARGFRRSGDMVYRPYCSGCRACVPVRIPVEGFRMNRSQRRAWRGNQDLVHRARVPGFRPAHFDLYQRYINTRHADGPMADPGPEQFMEFLGARWSSTAFHEFSLDDRIQMVAVLDAQPASLSAVYTFFEPEARARGLGTYAILWAVDHARALGKRWLYLGYWVAACEKMAYKSRFRPVEAFDDAEWAALNPDQTPQASLGMVPDEDPEGH